MKTSKTPKEKIPEKYYKVIDGKKVYYVNDKPIGDFLAMKNYIVNTKKIAFTKAGQEVDKIKELKDEK